MWAAEPGQDHRPGTGRAGLEVLIVVQEACAVLPVDELTGLLHVLGHAWGPAAEHPDLVHLLGDGEKRGWDP